MGEFDVLIIISPWMSLLGSIIIAVVLYRSFSLNKKALEDDNKTRFAQLLRDLDNDLQEQERRSHNLKSSLECTDYAIHYINTHERIAYLNIKKAIPNDIADFFNPSFSNALALKNWLNKIDPPQKDEWLFFVEYCKKYNITSNDKGIKDVVDKYEEIKNNNEASV